MKRNYIYLACMTVCMFALFAISSCSNEMDMPSSKIEHLQKMKQLCAQTPFPIALDEELIGVFTYEDKVKLLDIIEGADVASK